MANYEELDRNLLDINNRDDAQKILEELSCSMSAPNFGATIEHSTIEGYISALSGAMGKFDDFYETNKELPAKDYQRLCRVALYALLYEKYWATYRVMQMPNSSKKIAGTKASNQFSR